MSDSLTTATPETKNAAPTAHPPVRENQIESEVDRSQDVGQRVMRSIGGGSPEAPPEKFTGALDGGSGGLWRQMQRGYGNQYVGQVIQRKCDDCEKKEKIQHKGDGDLSAVPEGFEATMQQSGAGQPLDDGTRSFMESRFGQGFGDVRIHMDSAAAKASKQIQAQAFTTGRDIYFDRGRYQPEATEGKKLLAHELTHTIQQKNLSSVQTKLDISSPSDPLEQAADDAAAKVLSKDMDKVDKDNSSLPKTTHSLLTAPLIQRDFDPSAGGMTSPNAPASIPASSASQEPNSSSPSPAIVAERKLIDEALKSKDVGDVKRIKNYRLTSEDEKFTLIGILLDQTWVGPSDEYALEAIWGSFGDRVIKVASAHLELWNKCIEKGAELNDLPAIKKLEGQFQADVRTIVTGYLFQNRQFVITEMDRLGIPANEKANVPAPTLGQTEEVRRMQVAATEVAKLQKAQEESRNILVGFEPNPHRFEQTVGGNDPSAQWQTNVSPNFIPVYFNPYAEKPPLESDPDQLLSAGLGLPGSKVTPHVQVKDAYDAATKLITGYINLYPALYAISREGKSATTTAFAGTDSPVQAREQLGIAMRKLFHDIEETQKKLDEEKLDPLDLTPIHDQLLLGGMKGLSGTDWKDPLPKSVATELVKKHEFIKVLIDLGLQTAAAALFMLAPLTGGASLYVMLAGLAVTGVKLNISTQQYEAISLAAKTSAVPGTELVTSGQVDETKMAMEADQVAFALAALAVGSEIAGRVIGSIKGPKPKMGETIVGCFIAGTKVFTVHGLRSIEELIAGDKILSFSPLSREKTTQHLRNTFVHTVPVVLDIKIGTVTITCSSEHPFWVPGEAWQKAGMLKPNTPLLTQTDQIVKIDSICRREGHFTVFNIEVEGVHTYYVSKLGILVHNKGAQVLRTTPKGRALTTHAEESLPRHGFREPFTEVDNIMDNASRTTEQTDGARVYIQRTVGKARKYNLVIESEQGIVTGMKNLSPQELENLGRNYGFNPNP